MGQAMWKVVGGFTAAVVITSCTAVPAEVARVIKAQSVSGEPESSFMLMTLPDTQYYSAYHPQHFMNQTTWLAANAEALNVKLVTHLGDVVDNVGMAYQWRNADRAMQVLERSQVPYSVLAGNHDVFFSATDDTGRLQGAEPYLRHFSPERAARNSTFGGRDPSGWNEYHTFEAAGQEFLVLALNWRASPQTLAWAKGVMREHPGTPTILTTHNLLGYSGDQAVVTANGEYLWKNLIESSDQIFLTLSGHNHNHEVRAARLSRQNRAGHRVDLLMFDYQNGIEGGQGYLSGLEFDLARNRIEVVTFSPSLAAEQAAQTAQRHPLDPVSEHCNYLRDINFKQRFAAFAPDFPNFNDPRLIALTKRVQQALN